MMQREGFELLTVDGRPFRWSTALDGLFGEDRDWEASADALGWFLRGVPYADRNLIGHSHGGTVALLLAGSGFPLRSLTTVGTPPRDDVPLAAAEHWITFHQHLYDLRRDLWGWLGQVGDHELRTERALPDPHVTNIAVLDIRHSRALRDPKYIALWGTEGWLENIRRAAPAGV
jgi:pimeloyl-ACP methyl ester carboxylesterase